MAGRIAEDVDLRRSGHEELVAAVLAAGGACLTCPAADWARLRVIAGCFGMRDECVAGQIDYVGGVCQVDIIARRSV